MAQFNHRISPHPYFVSREGDASIQPKIVQDLTGKAIAPKTTEREIVILDEDKVVPIAAVYSVPGYFTYIASAAHLERCRALFLESSTLLPGVSVVAFSLVECYYADPDALEASSLCTHSPEPLR